jgi:hypothetical protein
MSQLKEKFDIKDLELLKYFLGIKTTHSLKLLFLSQRKYMIDVLTETGKIGCKPASTPITPLEDINQFQRLIEKLIYLTITHPDISCSVS